MRNMLLRENRCRRGPCYVRENGEGGIGPAGKARNSCAIRNRRNSRSSQGGKKTDKWVATRRKKGGGWFDLFVSKRGFSDDYTLGGRYPQYLMKKKRRSWGGAPTPRKKERWLPLLKKERTEPSRKNGCVKETRPKPKANCPQCGRDGGFR